MKAPARTIVTVTMNPALDEAVSLARFDLGATNRSRLDALDPGGKGINVSRVVRRMGGSTIAFGFVGGVTGQLLREGLDREGVAHAFDETDALTRINVMVYERVSGRRTRLYLDGPTIDAEHLRALRTRLERVAPENIVVFGGSLPPGVAPSAYGDLLRMLRERGVISIVDTSGAALIAALDGHPLLVKPNVDEAQEVLGRPLPDDTAVLAAARELCARGATYAVISQGADGAIGVGPEGAWKARPPHVEACSTVGSGDSMVAGLAIAFTAGTPFEEGLRLGTAAGAATAMAPGTRLCSAQEVSLLLPSVELHELLAHAANER